MIEIFIDNSGTAWLSMAEAGLTKIYYQKNHLHYFNFYESENRSRSKEIHSIKQSSDKCKFLGSFNMK
ncbi:MAG: hypothetical protein HC830_03120 [Bacteroidetes bacterium]|nr:hypothetical protein [Bacteroidota bacterium]